MADRVKIKSRSWVQENVTFGNGLKAVVLRREDGIVKDGVEYVRFALKPTEGLIQRYNIPDNLWGKGYVVKDYKAHLVKHLYNDPHIAREILIMCGYNGEKSPLMELFGAHNEEIERLKKENYLFKAHNIKLQDDMRRLRIRPLEGVDEEVEKLEKYKGLLGKETVRDGPGEAHT